MRQVLSVQVDVSDVRFLSIRLMLAMLDEEKEPAVSSTIGARYTMSAECGIVHIVRSASNEALSMPPA